jgi:hypothetical protein
VTSRTRSYRSGACSTRTRSPPPPCSTSPSAGAPSALPGGVLGQPCQRLAQPARAGRAHPRWHSQAAGAGLGVS